MNKAQPDHNTSDSKQPAEFPEQQTAMVTQPIPVRPASQLAPAAERLTRSCGLTEIVSLFGQPSPPDVQRKNPVRLATLANVFAPINHKEASFQENHEVTSITSSTRLYTQTVTQAWDQVLVQGLDSTLRTLHLAST